MTEVASDQPLATPPSRSGVGAALIAAGILLSRLAGLVRNTLVARYLGAGLAADAFNAALRIPNFLQNLFGDGAMSAAFIPVYSSLLGQGRHEEARRLANAVAAALALVTSVLVAAGIFAAPLLVDAITWGFEGERRALTIHLTRILFPGAGFFVFAAWALGVLSSHRRFFFGYAAPVAWNAAMIGTLLWIGPREPSATRVAEVVAIASVVGAALQFLVQLPAAIRLIGGLRPTLAASEHFTTVKRGLGPVLVSRGSVQISGFLDQSISSLLPLGTFSLVFFAQVLYNLPVSVFGMSVSAAELPELAREAGADAAARERIVRRVRVGLERIAYFIVPCAVAFIALGDVAIAALLQGGRFGATETLYTWGILAAASPGLLAATLSRLYSSVFYALHDTRTPFRFALVRIVLSIALGAALALLVTPALGVDRRWGGAGLTLGSAIAGWVEMTLLRRRLATFVGPMRVPAAFHVRVGAAALAAAAVAIPVKVLLPDMHRYLVALAVFGAFGIVYVGLTAALGVGDARRLLRRR